MTLDKLRIETLEHDLETANNTINALQKENKELKDRIEELSSKESSQRTAIEKAIEKCKEPTGCPEDIIIILEGKDEPFGDTKASPKPKLEGKP